MDESPGPDGLRVLLVGKAAPERGGIPSFLETLVERLPAAGVDAELLNLADHTPRAGGSLSGSNLWATIRDLTRLARIAGRFDVIHVHSACAPGPTLLRAGTLCAMGRLRGARTVLHVHGGLIAHWLHGARRTRTARWALAGADSVVAVASAPAAALADALERPVPVVPNGVHLDRFRPGGGRAAAGVPTVLVVGGLTPRKGILDVLEASERLLRRGLDHRLVLAGGTPDDGSDTHRRVMTAIEDAGKHVIVLPAVAHEEMPAHYQRADVFCLPSWWEAQPLSLLEAMACGVASVATDVGDVRALTGDGVAAQVVPPKDVPALTDALATLLSDDDQRRALGLAGRRLVEADRSIDRVLEAVVDLYRGADRPPRSSGVGSA